MPCKHLISTGLLLGISTFMACTPSSSKKDQNVPPVIQPLNPVPTTSPVPTATPTVTPVPALATAPLEKMLGDWQSNFTDPNHFGNITYSIKADGRILMSLLIYGKGKTRIMAERHEFQGSFLNTERKIQLEHIKGSCVPKNSKVTLSFSSSAVDPDILYLAEGSNFAYLRLNKLKSGLTQDVHSVSSLRGFTVEDGCFVEGRLNQFAPKQG